MGIIYKQKYKEVEDAIVNEKYPIILHGVSGCGKTHTLKEILAKHGLQLLCIELGKQRIKRPLNSKAVLHCHIYALKDLESHLCELKDIKIVFETTIEYIKPLSGITTIQFNKITKRKFEKCKKKKLTCGLVEDTVNMFRFIGKIFYKKIELKILEVDREWITLFRETIAQKVTTNRTAESLNIFAKPQIITSRSRIIESSSESEEVEERIENEEYYPLKCFFRPTVEAYLHENMYHFGNVSLISEFYDLLSLSDIHEYGLLSFIGCIKSKSHKPSTNVKFRLSSFKEEHV